MYGSMSALRGGLMRPNTPTNDTPSGCTAASLPGKNSAIQAAAVPPTHTRMP